MSWSWLSDVPVECVQSPEVELSTSSGTGQIPRRTLNSTSHNNTIEFNGTDLDCNTVYLPKVIATLKDNINVQPFTKYGNNILFGGNYNSNACSYPALY